MGNPNSCAEANLDVQYMLAMAPGSPMVYSYDASRGPVFEDWIVALSANPSPPSINSISYGAPETQVGVDNGGEEVACSGNTGGTITTGCGFSTNFDAPDWQTSAIAEYLSKDSPASGFASGRGYPDVAMAGFNYEVVIAGNTYKVSGTSASAPVVAGFATLVNSRLAEQG